MSYKYNPDWDDPNWCFRRNRIVSTAERELSDKMLEVMQPYVREMEGYSYFGSNPGIKEDDLEELITELITKLNLLKE